MRLTTRELVMVEILIEAAIETEKTSRAESLERLDKHVDDKYRQMDADNVAWSDNRVTELLALLNKIAAVGL